MKKPYQEPWASDVTFEEVIDRVASAADSQKNILTDGQLSCPYAEMPNVIESIHAHFVEKGISTDDTFVFECANSVPSALTILCMLYKGYSFVLLPPLRNKREKPGITPPTPKFCRYKVTTESSLDTESVAHHNHPETFLHIVENEQPHRERDVESNGEARLYLRTSGSLGSPKMAVHSHTKLLGNVLNCVKRLKLVCGDRITIPVPIFHLYGLGAAFLPGVVVGASIDLQERSNILRYLERERRFNPNVAFLTPALCDMLLKGHRSSKTYQLVVTAGDRMKKDAFLAFESRFGRLVNLYGSTEMGAITAAAPDDPLDVRAVTVGKPMTDVQMRLEEIGAEVGDETQVGELYCKREYGYAGYVDENGDWIVRGKTTQPGWFKTGDMGRIHRGGYIEVLGRCDHSVNRSGHLVLFADIENAMETIEGMERVVVVAKGESKWGQRIVAFCVPGKEAALNGAQVRSACFDILPRYAIPDDVSVVSSLPTLPNGKIDRPALVKMAPEGRDA